MRGWRVLDIFSPTKAEPHELTPFAKVDRQRITYPPVEEADPPTLWSGHDARDRAAGK